MAVLVAAMNRPSSPVAVTSANAMQSLRFVIHAHDEIDSPHFDLMFETSAGSSLTTWRSPNWPIDCPTTIVALPEHRREYLDYEGSVSGNRGVVRRVATGHCAVNQPAADAWLVRLFGDETIATLSLTHLQGDEWLAVPASEG